MMKPFFYQHEAQVQIHVQQEVHCYLGASIFNPIDGRCFTSIIPNHKWLPMDLINIANMINVHLKTHP